MRIECRDFYYVAADMWLKRPEWSFGREARAVANILHAGAKLKVDSHHDVMRRLFEEALRMSGGFGAQEAANSIWAVASMGVDDSRIVNGLSRACADRVKDLNPQNAANSIWAVATLSVTDQQVISSLSQACADRVRDFNPQAAANSIWAVATLGVTDPHVISSLSLACVERVKDFNPQAAANSIWAVATLGVTDPHVISSLSLACVERVKDFYPQDASNALWSAAVLTVKTKLSLILLLRLSLSDSNHSLDLNTLSSVFKRTILDLLILMRLSSTFMVSFLRILSLPLPPTSNLLSLQH